MSTSPRSRTAAWRRRATTSGRVPDLGADILHGQRRAAPDHVAPRRPWRRGAGGPGARGHQAARLARGRSRQAPLRRRGSGRAAASAACRSARRRRTPGSPTSTNNATHVVRTIARDATSSLDGILDNQAEPPIEKHTADAALYSDLVFALVDLLGPQFAPRLAGLRNTALAERQARRAAVWVRRARGRLRRGRHLHRERPLPLPPDARRHRPPPGRRGAPRRSSTPSSARTSLSTRACAAPPSRCGPRAPARCRSSATSTPGTAACTRCARWVERHLGAIPSRRLLGRLLQV